MLHIQGAQKRMPEAASEEEFAPKDSRCGRILSMIREGRTDKEILAEIKDLDGVTLEVYHKIVEGTTAYFPPEMKTHGNGGKRVPLTDQEIEIYARYKAGEKKSDIAADMGLEWWQVKRAIERCHTSRYKGKKRSG